MRIRKELEENILKQLLHKDPEVLKQIISFYSMLLYQVAYRITGSQRESEQILCEVFRELWENPNRFAQSKDNFFSSYLIKRCKLKCVEREEVHIMTILSKKSKKYIAKKATI
ncbi:sigma factor [Fictibacillus barbaricus]|uniref:RNA polymerase sigma-70 region 2 domain-containing protein n=1 Tax=Fictibacillus barbaricus TaxID=182136 RepID=A0ABS2ZBP4_9BACL|nr:sigma factor [Fictibacillus barbaricus]MBN3544866.1 hypothetical protein [Fictibacillus barbaricus]GGB63497.1 hypothetical protein GCM10007199_31880 [Fictibacillus barbaricus]